MTLGINIDHVAVLREARRVNDPDILQAMYVAIQAGADQITIHLREDRRHIRDTDAYRITKLSRVPVNLECSVDPEITKIVCDIKPHRATLVPEKREEVTTEGGLDIVANEKRIRKTIELLKESEIAVSLFIDPYETSIEVAKNLGADMVELHTGAYSNIFATLHSNLAASHHRIEELKAKDRDTLKQMLHDSLEELKTAAEYAEGLGLEVAVGHGLNYHNVYNITAIKAITELNIGQSIVARSVFTGLENAIREMKALVSK